ncbi:MAG: hypothetical protein HYU25_18135 [Candidatus Rokubacteria bacterium]|nr:hypothetical protein [Candidatus Rokubacteria bacterium]
MAKPLAPDLDQRPAVGFEGVARVEIGGAVGADDLPVRPAGQDAPREPLAAERAADDVDHAPLPEGRPTEGQDLSHLDVGVEQRPEREHGIGARPSRRAAPAR